MYNYRGDRTDTGLCMPLWSIHLKWQRSSKIMHTLQAQVCGCFSAHPGLPHQKTKRETSDASKSQLNQASLNRTALKFRSENQLNVHSYLSILLCDFPLIARSGTIHVTTSFIGCTPHTCSIGPWHWKILELLAFEYEKLVLTKNKFRKTKSM